MWLAGHPPLLGFSGHPNHNPARLLDALCLAYILWYVPRALDRRLRPVPPCKFLNLLGRHSLQVFMFSMVIARFEAHTITTLPLGAKLVLTILTVLSLALPAWVHERYQSSRAPGSPEAAVPLRPQPAS
jgi:hypothetical protein